MDIDEDLIDKMEEAFSKSKTKRLRKLFRLQCRDLLPPCTVKGSWLEENSPHNHGKQVKD